MPNTDTFNVLNSESKILKALFLYSTIVTLSIERLQNVNLNLPGITNSDIMEKQSTVKNHSSYWDQCQTGYYKMEIMN